MAHISFFFGVQPCGPFGHLFIVIRGHFSQAMPHTPIFMIVEYAGARLSYISEMECLSEKPVNTRTPITLYRTIIYRQIGKGLLEAYAMRRYKDIPLWKDVSPKQWTDWKWQVRNRITDVDTLAKVINLTPKEKEEITHSMKYLRMAITPYYASLMDPDDPSCPIRKQAVPTSN